MEETKKLNGSWCLSDIVRVGSGLLADACKHLGPREQKGDSAVLNPAVFNSLPWERNEVVQLQEGTGPPSLGMFTFTFEHFF